MRDVAPNEISEAVESFRSAFLPMHCKPDGGKLYRKGDVVAATPGNYEVFSKIQGFFLVKVNDDYQSLVLGDTFQVIIGPDGAAARHPVSDTVFVQPAPSSICLGLKDLKREIMLYPETGDRFAVVDPFRGSVHLPRVVVPVYPEVGDFVHVTGQDADELWRAVVTEVNFHTRTVGGYFYVKHSNFDDNRLWVKERPHRKETIQFTSIVAISGGEWVGTAWREL